jgi:hypothetical protein
MKELIVYYNKNIFHPVNMQPKGIKGDIPFIIIGVLVACGCLTSTHFLTWMLKFGLGFIGVMVLAGSYYYLMVRTDQPVAILNEQGIRLKEYGFISWDSITEMSTVTYGAPIEMIGIRVKDLSVLYKQASIAGKMGIFWSKIFRYYPVYISNIAIPAEHLLAFAQEYLDEKVNI